MLYFKAPGRCMRKDFISTEWGSFIRYVEVADDQYVAREVQVFDNGNVLRYDRTHWCDDFAMLLLLKFSRKPKWAIFFPGAEVISATDFDKAWRLARQSDLWQQQINSSRVPQWGEYPER